MMIVTRIIAITVVVLSYWAGGVQKGGNSRESAERTTNI